GIVVNNGIILIDYTKTLRNRGYRRSRALMMAGVARIRPIMITALTTILALLPLAMGQAEYVSVIGASFAITVIGGLSLSTMLTLVFIPTFYSGLENAIDWIKSLSTRTKIIQLCALAALLYLVFTFVNTFIWQLITTILSVIIVPAATWFIINSLRKAKESVIPQNEPINIQIQSLVKIYDRESRWLREWKAGARIRRRLGLEKEIRSLKDMENMTWQLPLFGFLIYFTYFYLSKGFWVFFFSIITWLALFGIWSSFRQFLTNLASKNQKLPVKNISRIIEFIVMWFVPLFNLVFFQIQWKNIATVLILGFVWYASILVYITGEKLTRENIDIYRLQGRFRELRKTFYKIVLMVPLIGKRKKPFKALNCVSMTIGSGMFGLLGPNGAGKTTLMRIICGILEQSYGKVWINGIDTQKKREELQGLIGYLPQEFGTYENMTAHEYLHYMAILKNITDPEVREERVTYALNAVHMADRRFEKISSYSGGMKQRIGIAQILLHLPRILVVDEPTAGLDPRERIRFRNLLVELSRERVVIFSTHIIEDISSSCTQVAVLDRGNLKYLGRPIDMAVSAEGHVWQITMHASEFKEFIKDHLVVHHMSEGNMVKLRCISEEKPWETAIKVTPNLEDAYLWLLRRKNNGENILPETNRLMQ
ncbi:MAG TPA: efflux RND transporter permease subunit, partial [Bacteroidales bacterium]|nr:efflux RND transporter permease subunit [Bacteroidales bacterium]